MAGEEFELILDSVMAEGEEGGGAGDVIAEPVVDEQVEGTEGGDGKEAGETEGEETDKGQGDEKSDGRKNPDATRKHLAALKANPETAELGKELTNRLGKVRGYEEVYPTVKEAREVKQLLESVGGREQVTAAIESHATLARVDQALKSGNPAAVEELFKTAPEGMVKLGGPILDQIAKANPAEYQKLLVPHAVQMMQKDGLPGAFNAMVDAFNKDDKAAMQDVLGRVVAYYNDLLKGAKPAAKDPDREKFETEKSDWEKTRANEEIKATFNQNLSYSGDKIDGELKGDIARLKLGPKAVEKLRQEVWKVIETKRNASPGYEATINAKYAKDKADAVKYMNGFTDRFLKEATDEVVETFYGKRPAAGAKPVPVKDPLAAKKQPTPGGKPAGAAAPAGFSKVTEMPARKDINYDDPRTDVFNGKAVLKSGKAVNWR